jgi:hypothetical protein
MTAVLAATLAVAPWQALDAGTRSEQLAALAPLPIEQRFTAATEGFLGTRYVLSPLGEGVGVDADPLVRYDAADCVTMVESAIALALSTTDDEVLPTLNRIRYAGEPSYEGRLHVMEAQWLPVNLERGLIEDVTRRYGGEATRRVTKRITDQTWKEKSGASLKLPDAAQVKGVFELDLVPSEVAPAVLAKAPEGLIVVVVRADRPRLVSRITHVGVLVQKPVERYLRRNLEFGAWTVEGVSLYRVKERARAAEPAPVATAAPLDAGSPELVDAGPAVPVVASPAAPGGCGCAASAGPWIFALACLALSRRRRLATRR